MFFATKHAASVVTLEYHLPHDVFMNEFATRYNAALLIARRHGRRFPSGTTCSDSFHNLGCYLPDRISANTPTASSNAHLVYPSLSLPFYSSIPSSQPYTHPYFDRQQHRSEYFALLLVSSSNIIHTRHPSASECQSSSVTTQYHLVAPPG